LIVTSYFHKNFKLLSRLFPVNALIDKLIEFLKLKGDQIKLEVMSRVAKVLANILVFMIIGFVGLMLIFFMSVTLAVIINHALESDFYGHLIVSGLMLLFLLVLILFLKTGKIQKWLENIILSMAEDEDE
jgi:hypothetical protein